MKGRCVVVLGGEIEDYENIRRALRSDDYFIFCDSGLFHEEGLGVKADLAVGDFDSHPRPEGVESVVFPPEKDDTDAYIGIKEGIRRGFTDFLILGALGRRIDHEIANIYLLDYLSSHSCTGVILDGTTRLRMVSKEETVIASSVEYFSLLALSGTARSVTIKGAKYNLEDAVIEPSFQYGISNEVKDDSARVSVGEGRLLLVEIIRDASSHPRTIG